MPNVEGGVVMSLGTEDAVAITELAKAIARLVDVMDKEVERRKSNDYQDRERQLRAEREALYD